jgi:hypothetical protein
VTTTGTMGTLYAAIVAATTGNFALAASIPFLVTAFNILTAAALPLAAALIPLTAAIALTGLVRATNDLADANDALESYGQQILTTADAVGSISAKLKALNKIREDGGSLNEEQIKQEKQLRAAAKAQAESIEAIIKAQKDLTKLSADQTIQRDNQIKQLEALRKKLDVATGGLSIEAKELEKLGTSYEQLAKKVDSANRNIRTGGGGDPEVFKKSVAELLKATEQQVKLRQVNLADAASALEQIRADTRVEVDVQQQAKDTIVKIYAERVGAIKELLANGLTDQRQSLQELAEIRDRAEVKDDPKVTAEIRKKAAQEIISIRQQQNAAELAEIEASKGKIEALQAAQRLSEAEGDRQLTLLKQTELDKRLEQNQVARENATSDVERQKLLAEQGKLFADREKIEADFEKRSNDRAVAAFDARRKQIQALYDLGILDQQTYNKAKLDNDLEQQDLALKQQQIALDKLDVDDGEGRALGLARIAEINSKKETLIREGFEAEKKRSLTDYDEQLGELDRFNAQKLIGEGEYQQAKVSVQLGRADEEIAILKQQSARLGVADKDGREAIQAQISKLEIGKIKILEEGYAKELELVKDRERKAVELVKASQEQRAIELQKLVNSRQVRQEDADKERSRQNVINQQAELQQARDFETALARTAGAVRTPEAERAYQQQVREARARTLAVTLQLLQTEGTELERLRTLTLKGIEDGVAARTRAADLQLSQLASVRAVRLRSLTEAEAGVAREVAAIEIATKALERQNGLIVARNNLQKANFDAQASGNELELAAVVRSLEIRKELDTNTNLSFKERQILQEQLTALSGNASVREVELLNRKAAIEQRQLESKREGVLFEQAAAKAALSVEQQKIDLANQRLVIEARIAEFKAKQGVLDARSVVDQTELNNRKSIEAANLEIDRAKALQPGRERDRAIAEAQNKLAIAKTEAETNAANALQGVDLANQQVDLAKQNTQAALEQVKNQAAIKKTQVETLDVQQKMVLKQLEAAEAAKLYAAALERAKYAAQGINIEAPENNLYRDRRQPVNSIDPNADLTRGYTNIPAYKPVTSAPLSEREQTAQDYQKALDRAKSSTSPVVPTGDRIDPNTDFTQPINIGRGQILKNLGGFKPTVPGSDKRGKDADMSLLIKEVKALQEIISSRPPVPIVANFNGADDGQLDKLFALQRSSLRIS